MRSEIGSLTKQFELKGLSGNEKVNTYYAENGKVRAHDPALRHLRTAQDPAGLLVDGAYNLITNLMREQAEGQR